MSRMIMVSGLSNQIDRGGVRKFFYREMCRGPEGHPGRASVWRLR